jgi:phosphotriesterase-related protein
MNRVLTRRDFMARSAVGLAASCVGHGAGTSAVAEPGPVVMTVTGSIPADTLGLTLPHEHVTTDFLGAERLPSPRYSREQALTIIAPHLKALHQRGVRALVECTPAHIGRDPSLLKALSEETAVRIVTNCGYYGAVENKFLPRHAFEESARQVSERWLREWTDGIEGTGIRPGFLKLGTGRGPLPELHAKLLRAACRVHRETGLTIAVHTGDGEAARDEVRILAEEGVAPDALIWVHAQQDAGPIQIELARRGVWISLDGYNLAHRNPKRYRNALESLKREDVLGRVLMSHDDGWAVEGEAPEQAPLRLFDNGNRRPYASIFERLLPDLRDAGFTENEIHGLMVANPSKALGIRRRLLA